MDIEPRLLWCMTMYSAASTTTLLCFDCSCRVQFNIPTYYPLIQQIETKEYILENMGQNLSIKN